MNQSVDLSGSTTLSPAIIAQLRALLASLPAEAGHAAPRDASTWQILPDISAARRLSGHVFRRLVGSARAPREKQPTPISRPLPHPAPAIASDAAARTTARVLPGSLRQVLIPDPAPRTPAPATLRVRTIRAARRGTAA